LSLRERCGVYGVYSDDEDAFPYLYWGMLAQNHRGHQSHGFATLNGVIEVYTELGLIPPITESGIESRVKQLRGNRGIGNVRYATSGSSDVRSLKRDAMPILDSDGRRSVAITFNGNVVNIRDLQDAVGVDRSYSDAHALCRLILSELRDTGSVVEAARSCMEIVDGSFAVTGLTDDGVLFAFKDPVGVKPLCYGCREGVKAFSSESVGLDINEIDLEREITPGEAMTIEDGTLTREQVMPCRRRAFCAFEFAYFARPDSIFDHRYVYEARRDFGANLAKRYSDIASRCEVVLSLPETANDAAYGFHEASGLPWDMATRRHRYVTQRAFISGFEERSNVVYRKVNILKPRVTGRRLAVVDDSIVRGDTTRSVVQRLRSAGAQEVHLFITFPKIIGPCPYGIDMATFGELIGAKREPEEIAREVDADSVSYQPIDDYVRGTKMQRNQLCLGCVTGEYPTPLANKLIREMKERLDNGESEKGRIYEDARS
jgi:amidophosphoribosyltransferase